MNSLKDFILEKVEKYKFKIVKINEKDLNLKRINFERLQSEFREMSKEIQKNRLANFLFLLRVIDFRLWEFPENWKYENKKGFYGLLERTKDLFKVDDLEKIDFIFFKKIISPKESLSLAKLRFKFFRQSLNWLNKNFDGDFNNYFEENKKPIDFCLNLFKLEKFRDYYKSLHFLKPNQLLYYEYLLGMNMYKKFEKELNELTIFADYKIPQILVNFGLIEIPKNYIKKLKRKDIVKRNSVFEIELRLASIILGERLSEKFKIPSYLLDTILWDLSNKIKLKIPFHRTKTIFY